jgi:hypothetical protein
MWTLENWKKYYKNGSVNVRSGIRLKFDKDVDSEVKRACKEFCKWLRMTYCFPIRVPIYVKSSYQIKSMDGELVSATFFEPINKFDEPYVRLATGDYYELLNCNGKDDALAAILSSIAHELTHYFQWINDVELTEIGRERQAKSYSNYILNEYSETREHP